MRQNYLTSEIEENLKNPMMITNKNISRMNEQIAKIHLTKLIAASMPLATMPETLRQINRQVKRKTSLFLRWD